MIRKSFINREVRPDSQQFFLVVSELAMMSSNEDSDIDVAVKPVGDEGRCTKVYSKRVYTSEDNDKSRGLSSLIYIKCTKCKYINESYTSSTIKSNAGTPGRNTFDVNIRATYAMRRCGVGLAGMETFCGLLNMPPPISQHSYDNISKKVLLLRKLRRQA